LLTGHAWLLSAALAARSNVSEPSAEDVAKVAADGEPVLQKGAAGSGDELSAEVMMGSEEEAAEEPACEEGNDDCMQRRLLRDAHLDYIYTQHKGKP